MDNSITRRHLLRTTAGTATALGLAGCSTLTGNNNDQDTDADEITTTAEFTGQTSIKRRTSEKVTLPTVWKNNHELANFSTVVDFDLQANRQIETVEIAVNGKKITELEAGAKQVRKEGFEIPVYALDAGENKVQVRGKSEGETFTTEKVSVEKNVPGLTKLDAQKAVNKKLRKKAREKEGNGYIKKHEVAADQPPYSNYQTPEKLEYNKMPIDLAALEYWHDNDLHHMTGPNSAHTEVHDFVDSIGDPDKSVANDPKAIYYPNADLEDGDLGSFSTYNFTQADVGQALEWFQRYYFNWEDEHDSGSISTEDAKHAAALQEAFDRYRNGEVHAWAFGLPENSASIHGNGMVWDEKNDELYVMETITSPETATRERTQLAPQVENSNYLPPDLRKEMGGQTDSDNKAYSHWWHPLRFDGTEPDNGLLSFSDGKDFATTMLQSIADSSTNPDFYREESNPDNQVTLTTGYVEDRIKKLRNYNQNSFDFGQLKSEAKIIRSIEEVIDENAVIYRDDTDSLQVAAGDGISDQLLTDIWKDQEGKYDDFDAYLEQNGQKAAGTGAVSMKGVDGMLEGNVNSTAVLA